MYTGIKTKQGYAGIVWREDGVVESIRLPTRGEPAEWSGRVPTPRSLRLLVDEIERYFVGEDVEFSDFNFDWSKQTPFQMRVYEFIRTIPRGETMSYGKVAAAIGSPGGAQAVGQAMGSNPCPIIVPCHRVVAAGGKLGGFGGGLPLKEEMLRLENALIV